MRKPAFFLVFYFLFYFSENLNAQSDTIQQDSVRFYNDLHEKVKDKKVANFLYKLLFKVPGTTRDTTYYTSPQKIKRYNGKIIREIEIVILRPFGSPVNGATKDSVQLNFLERVGNATHVLTQNSVVKNILLFKKNQKLNTLDITESERLLRVTGFIRDAKIVVKPLKGKSSDSVDVYVITQDLWTLKPAVAASPVKLSFKLVETNFLGLGHTLDNGLLNYPRESPRIIYNGIYTAPNIAKTFISGSFFWSNDFPTSMRGISFSRPFFSPTARWAGGLSYIRNKFSDTIIFAEVPDSTINLTSDYKDAWLGKSFTLDSGVNKDEIAQLVIAGRVSNTHYLERPSFDYDLTHIYQNSTLYLCAAGLTHRHYYTDYYLFKFGTTEDIPEGRIIEILGGIQHREFQSLYYGGIKYAVGSHFDNFGYLSLGVEYGSFFDYEFNRDRSVLKAESIYFTDAIKINRWRVRQYLSSRLTLGKRVPLNEVLNLNGYNGIYGFDSEELLGISRLAFNLQTVVYAPYSILGFRFAPILFVGAGLIGGRDYSLWKSRLYSGFGLGLLIRNEYLVLSTLEVSFAIYPVVPGLGSPLFKYNPLHVSDNRFMDFDVKEPAIITFE